MKLSLVMNSLLLFAAVAIQTATAETSIQRKLFTLEKSVNSENILLIHTQTDENCKFISNQNGYIDFFWLMNGENKKEVHSMIRSKVAERVQFLGISKDRTSFIIKLNDLSELRTDLEDNKIEVRSQMSGGNCVVKSIIKLGASANYKKLNLKRTFCDVEKNFAGIPNGCKVLDLKGSDADTSEALTIRLKTK